MSQYESRVVKQTTINHKGDDYLVSTVELPYCAYPKGTYETMVFKGDSCADLFCARSYHAESEALNDHEAGIEFVKGL
jgi:hypothetical protein